METGPRLVIPQCTIGGDDGFAYEKRAENGDRCARSVILYLATCAHRSSPTSTLPCFSLFFIFLLHRFSYPPYSSISSFLPLQLIVYIRFFYLFLRSSSYIPPSRQEADRKLKIRGRSCIGREKERGRVFRLR